MRTARRRRTTEAVVLSVAAHAAVLTALWFYAPRLMIPKESAGPPVPIIPVLIMPRALPPPAGTNAPPAPIRLHRRPQRFAPAETPVAPLVAPVEEAPKPAPAAPAPKAAPGPPQEPTTTNLRATLRGRLGCQNADALRLSREEREKCNEQLGAAGRGVADMGLGIDPDKAAGFAATAARKAADAKFRSAPGTPPRAPGALGSFGASAHDMGAQLGNDRREAKAPF